MNRLIKCLALVVLVAGSEGELTREVTDVTMAKTLIMEKNPEQKRINSLSVTGSGEIQGSAEIALILNGGPYKTKYLSGVVGFKWEGDWYSDQAEIRYIPASVTGGKPTLTYKLDG